jgi:hypothetical protein
MTDPQPGSDGQSRLPNSSGLRPAAAVWLFSRHCGAPVVAMPAAS